MRIEDVTGNVGIGTTSPTATLDVSVDSSSTETFKLTQNGTADIVNIFDGGTEVFTILNDDTSATGTTVLTVRQDAAQNGVLIDQNADGQSFVIDSESTTANVIDINNPQTTTGRIFDVNAASLTTGNIMYLESNSADTNTRNLVEIINNNTLATGAVPLRLQQDSTGDIFQVYDGVTEVFTILDGGNVGIGATAPDADLHVQSSSTTKLRIESDDDSDTFLVFKANGTNKYTVGYESSTGNLDFTGTSFTNNKYMSLNSGNLGIGTTTPTATLDVSVDSSSTETFKLTQNGTADIVNIFDGATEVFTILDGGNVGIGTTSPNAPLSFPATTGEKIRLYNTQNYGFGIQSSLMQIYANASADRVGIGYGGSDSFTETLTIKGSNVGIGDTPPTATLGYCYL